MHLQKLKTIIKKKNLSYRILLYNSKFPEFNKDSTLYDLLENLETKKDNCKQCKC